MLWVKSCLPCSSRFTRSNTIPRTAMKNMMAPPTEAARSLRLPGLSSATVVRTFGQRLEWLASLIEVKVNAPWVAPLKNVVNPTVKNEKITEVMMSVAPIRTYFLAWVFEMSWCLPVCLYWNMSSATKAMMSAPMTKSNMYHQPDQNSV